MSVDQLSAVPKSEQASAIATVVSAFTDDPVERWLFLDTDEYLTHVSALAWRQPRHARAGLGGELLTSCLAMAGDSHLPAYRETPNPRTVPLSERHGFQVIAVAQAGTCPPMTLMLRAAQ
jgi:hypothetical protein